MKRMTIITMAGALVLGTPALVACGSSSEQTAETAIEAAGGGNVDVDISENGESVKVEDVEGNTMQAGGSGPASWPSDVPLPEGLTFMSEIVQGQSVITQWELPKEGFVSDIIAPYIEKVSDAFTEGGYEITDGAGTGSYTRDSGTLNIIVGGGILTLSYEPKTP